MIKKALLFLFSLVLGLVLFFWVGKRLARFGDFYFNPFDGFNRKLEMEGDYKGHVGQYFFLAVV